MTISEYSKKIRLLSEHSLYELAMKSIIQENLGKRINPKKSDLIIDECKRRGNGIFDDALDDAMVKINALEAEFVDMKVNSVIRLTHMNDSELNKTIKANNDIPDLIGIKKENMIICEVSGNSMEDININDGDNLLVDKTQTPTDESIIVAKIDGQLYVKRLRIIDDTIWLYSENKTFPPVQIDDSNFSIIGVVQHKIV